MVSREAETKFPAPPFSELSQSSGAPARRETGRARRREKPARVPPPRSCRRRRDIDSQQEDSLSELSSVSESASSHAAALRGQQRGGNRSLRGSAPPRGVRSDFFPTNAPSASSGDAGAISDLPKSPERLSPALRLSVSRLLSPRGLASTRDPPPTPEPRTAVRPAGGREIRSPVRSRSLSKDYDGEPWNELSCQLSVAFNSSYLSEDQDDDEPHSRGSLLSVLSSETRADSRRFAPAGHAPLAPPTGGEQTSFAFSRSPGAEPSGRDGGGRGAAAVPRRQIASRACCPAAVGYVWSSCSFLGTCAPFLSGSRGLAERSPVSAGQLLEGVGRDREGKREDEPLRTEWDSADAAPSGSAEQKKAVRVCRANSFAPPPGIQKARHAGDGEEHREDRLPRDADAGSSKNECSLNKTDEQISSRSREDQGEPQLSCNGNISRSSSASHSFFSLSSPSAFSCGSSSVPSCPSSPSDTGRGKTCADGELRKGREPCRERVERQTAVPADPNGSQGGGYTADRLRASLQGAAEASTGLTAAETVLASVGKGVATAIECGAASLVDLLVDTLPRLSPEPNYSQVRVRTSGSLMRPRSCSPTLLRRERTRFSSFSRALSSCGLPSLCSAFSQSPDEQKRQEKPGGTDTVRDVQRDGSWSTVAPRRIEAGLGFFETEGRPVESPEQRTELDKRMVLHMLPSFSSLRFSPVPAPAPSLREKRQGGWGLVEGRLRTAPATLLEGRGGQPFSPNGPLNLARTGRPEKKVSLPSFVHPVSSPQGNRGEWETKNPLNGLPSSHSQFVTHERPSHTPQRRTMYPADTDKTRGIAPFYATSVEKSRGTYRRMPEPVSSALLHDRVVGDRTTPLLRGRHFPTLQGSGASVVRSPSAGTASPPFSGAPDASSPGVPGSCGSQTSRVFTPSIPALVGRSSPATEERTPDAFCCHATSKTALTPCTTAATSVASSLRQLASEKQPLEPVPSSASSSPSAPSSSGFSAGLSGKDGSTRKPLQPEFVATGEEGTTSRGLAPSGATGVAMNGARNAAPVSPEKLPFSFSAPSGFCSAPPGADSATEFERRAANAERSLHSAAHLTRRWPTQHLGLGEETPRKMRKDSGRRWSGESNSTDIPVHRASEGMEPLFPSNCRGVNVEQKGPERPPSVQRGRTWAGSARASSAGLLTSEASSPCLGAEVGEETGNDEQGSGRTRLPAVLRARWLLEELQNQADAGALTRENFPMEEVLDLMKHFDVLDVGGVSVYRLEADWQIPEFFPQGAPSEEWVHKNHADGVNFMLSLQEITTIATDLYREPCFPSCRLQSQGNLDAHAPSEPVILTLDTTDGQRS
ncbi:conserved hypothetical protein [Neospora caninum Liverpool]|nr:conserved hypothetical protein [Neospora caninum Liverpool]CBZ49521.1 conserved hypothetical protein [Neospora caninum Liverpool]|eukprot:XP_003879556.1 conserved hypothetical protein [Neospora caninum Liverpool]